MKVVYKQVSYTMASFWLFLAWAGFVIALGGLAGVQVPNMTWSDCCTCSEEHCWPVALTHICLQGYNNAQANDSMLRNRYMHANYPARPFPVPRLPCRMLSPAVRQALTPARGLLQDLDGGSLLRFDWFTIFLLFIVLGLVTIALVTRELVRVRLLPAA